ncbi:hypothetical protein LEMLEM_LOCUS7571, partial [Lemmus lemmus]
MGKHGPSHPRHFPQTRLASVHRLSLVFGCQPVLTEQTGSEKQTRDNLVTSPQNSRQPFLKETHLHFLRQLYIKKG